MSKLFINNNKLKVTALIMSIVAISGIASCRISNNKNNNKTENINNSYVYTIKKKK